MNMRTWLNITASLSVALLASACEVSDEDKCPDDGLVYDPQYAVCVEETDTGDGDGDAGDGDGDAGDGDGDAGDGDGGGATIDDVPVGETCTEDNAEEVCTTAGTCIIDEMGRLPPQCSHPCEAPTDCPAGTLCLGEGGMNFCLKL